jgi:hypothetical protein
MPASPKGYARFSPFIVRVVHHTGESCSSRAWELFITESVDKYKQMIVFAVKKVLRVVHHG